MNHECNLKICVTCMKGNVLLLEYVYILDRIKLGKMKIYVVKFKTNKNYKPFTKNKKIKRDIQRQKLETLSNVVGIRNEIPSEDVELKRMKKKGSLIWHLVMDLVKGEGVEERSTYTKVEHMA